MGIGILRWCICINSISFDFGSIEKGPHRFELSFEKLAVEPY